MTDWMKVVYRAGPYGGKNFAEIEQHIVTAEVYAVKLWNLGYGVFCPHLNTAHFEVKAKAPESAYKEFDLRMLEACDAVFVLPGWMDSAGTKAEMARAREIGLPVINDLQDLQIVLPA